jgi:L-lysine 2,3-aminomutase
MKRLNTTLSFIRGQTRGRFSCLVKNTVTPGTGRQTGTFCLTKDGGGGITMEEWQRQMKNQVNTLEDLARFICVTDEEKEAIKNCNTKWGTTPYFASLMDPDDPKCPIRKQIVPSRYEQQNKYGIENYLVFKENRDTDEDRPDTIARQYMDRIAFTIVNKTSLPLIKLHQV